MFSSLKDLIDSLFKANAPAISQTDVNTIKEDLLTIKAFLGIPDVRIGATQADLDAFSAKLAKATQTVTAFDAEIKATQAVQGFDEGLQKDAH